jgi:DNA-directed RNA polymerase specialized sigma24 family protein
MPFSRRRRGKMASTAFKEPDWEELRKRLLARAATGMPRADAEDVTQEALLRVLRDRRPSPLPIRQRAFRKLKDVRAERFRDPRRRADAEVVSLSELREARGREDVALALVELETSLGQEMGPDVLAYAQQKARGCTDTDIAAALSWSPQRVEAASRRLRRHRTSLDEQIFRSGS